MSKMIDFEVNFDKSDKKYYSGEIIKCNIQVKVKNPIKARSFLIRFSGAAHVEWRVTQGTFKGARKAKRIGDEEYFKYYEYLFGDDNGMLHKLSF